MAQVHRFLFDFLSGSFFYHLKQDSEVPQYYCIIVCFSLHICFLLLNIFKCSNAGYEYVCNCYIFLMDSPPHYYIMIFPVSGYHLGLKIIFFWYKYNSLHFLYFSLSCNIIFYSFTESMCVLRLNCVSCKQLIVGSCFCLFICLFYPFSHFVPLDWQIQFIYIQSNVIIDKFL